MRTFFPKTSIYLTRFAFFLTLLFSGWQVNAQEEAFYLEEWFVGQAEQEAAASDRVKSVTDGSSNL